MASANTLALRARMQALTPTRIPLDVQPTPRTALPGDFADALRVASLGARARRKQARTAANGPRDIPTSGTGRRRAKAHRNLGLCLAADNGARCGRHAEQFGRCPTHLTREFLREHGALEVADITDALDWRDTNEGAA